MEKIKEEKQFKESVGIDISKLTVDVFIYNKKSHRQFANNQAGFILMQKWIKSETGNNEQIIYCFEHTGWYCILLSHFCNRMICSIVVSIL